MIKSKFIGSHTFSAADGTNLQEIGSLQVPTFGPAQLMYIGAGYNAAPSPIGAKAATPSAIIVLESPLITGDQEFLVNDLEREQTIPYNMQIPGGTEIAVKAKVSGAVVEANNGQPRLSVSMVYDQ